MAIALLGPTGMLGNMIHRVVPNVVPLDRSQVDATRKVRLKYFKEYDKVINCIGLIKPYCGDVQAAIKVNALFPHRLPTGSLQIATDCVYSGSKGNYVETDPHDALDVYGKTKSLGEAQKLKNLRCSIIGPELRNHISLLDWFLEQEKEVNGFTNHLWNGITTYHFARIVYGIIRFRVQLPSLQHIVPADIVTKAELLQIIAEEFSKDIIIKSVEAPEPIDRTLATLNPELNKKLWQVAGYDEPPTIRQMVRELAAL